MPISNQMITVLATFVFLSAPTVAQVTPDQAALVAAFREGSTSAMFEAAVVAREIPVSEIQPELRRVLIEGLEDSNHRFLESASLGSTLQGADFELRMALVVSVARLEDKTAVPALVEALGTGGAAARTLALFPESADLIISKMRSASSTEVRQDGMFAISILMAERRESLSRKSLEGVRETVLEELEQGVMPGTLLLAVDAAVASQDPILWNRVARLASHPEDLVARGINRAHAERVAAYARQKSEAAGAARRGPNQRGGVP